MTTRINKFADGHLTIEGVSSGVAFAVAVYPQVREANWIEPSAQPIKMPSVAGAPEAGKPCEGCGKSLIQKILSGTVGIGKAVLGVDKTPESVMDDRYDICNSCEFNRRGVCSVCDCIVPLKILVGGEECPKQKWLKLNGD